MCFAASQHDVARPSLFDGKRYSLGAVVYLPEVDSLSWPFGCHGFSNLSRNIFDLLRTRVFGGD